MSACSGPCSERACAALAVEAESSPVGCSRSMERAELDARQRIILVGDDELVAATYRELVSAGCAVTCVPAADADNELPSRLEDAATLVIATRQDALVLRLVLLAADLRPDLPRVVTVFDRTLAERLRQGRLACTVVSSAEIVAGAVAGPCVDPSVDALRRVGRDIEEIRVGADPVRRRHTRRAQERIAHAFDHAVGVLRPFDTSARILVAGIAGLLAMLLTDLVVGIAFLHEGFVDALLLATRTLATVAANDAVARASPAIRVASVITMIGTIASIAIFSAGLVSRLVEPRHLGIVGRRALPHRDHVVIVGMGQIGLRTALLLRAAGMRVVALGSRSASGSAFGSVSRSSSRPGRTGSFSNGSARNVHDASPRSPLTTWPTSRSRSRLETWLPEAGWCCAPAMVISPARRDRCSSSASFAMLIGSWRSAWRRRRWERVRTSSFFVRTTRRSSSTTGAAPSHGRCDRQPLAGKCPGSLPMATGMPIMLPHSVHEPS